MNWAQRASKSGTDRWVAFASGETPIKSLDESRTAFRLVVGVAGLAFIASGWLLWHMITTEAKLPPLQNNTNGANELALEKLKTKDTDEDGLSDYNELYTYGSSPYLYSSAGDGVSDSDKVAKGVNPNCPQGQTCSLPTLSTSGTTSGTVSIDFLRQALKASGAPANTVDQADDATILKLYQNATKSGAITDTNPGITNTANTNTNSANTNASNTNNGFSPTVDQLSDMTGAEIRSLLQTSGVDTTTLSEVDDATLKTIFLEAINTNSAGT